MNYLCVVESFFGDTPGGAGRVAWDVARAMRDRGDSVTMLAYREGTREAGPSECEGIRLVRFEKEKKPSWHPGRLRAIVDSTEAACRKWLSDTRWDVVHIHSSLMGLGALSALGAGPRYLTTVHSPLVLEQEINWRSEGLAGRVKLLFGRRALARAEGRLLAAVAGIHVLSQFTRDAIDAAHAVAGKTTVIPHWYEPAAPAVDPASARKALGWPAGEKIFLTVRGPSPRYGIDVAIRALAPLVRDERRGCRFYVGGGGSLRPDFRQLASRLGAGDRIRFLGWLSEAQLELAYAAADAFVLPTLALECFGLIVVEALSFGCPVIATDAGAIPELLRPILPDCIVPAGDAPALARKAEAFVAGRLSVPDRSSLIAHAQERYAKQTIVPRFVQLFEAHGTTGVEGSHSALDGQDRWRSGNRACG